MLRAALLATCVAAAHAFAGVPRVVSAIARADRVAMSGAAGTAAGGGGDLEGGDNEERNAQLNALRSMFAAPAAEVEPLGDKDAGEADADEARRLGVLLDLPLCRFSWCILPHHQVTIKQH